MSEYPEISLVVPHSAPMVLLDRIVDWSPGHIECSLAVEKGSRFVDDGELAAVFTIEHMAQAVAACLGVEAYLGGRGVRVGMIVACRTFKASRPAASVGEALTVFADRERGNESLSHFQCAINREGDPFATATLTLVHDESLVSQGI